ncbi:MAG: glucose-1-phosphate adenylyltransferase [Bradymonadia bacterium]
MPIVGRYRIIDFVLSNFVNSGYDRIYVLTQFMASSLIHHLNKVWHISGPTGGFIEEVPAQMRAGQDWYRGTADSVYQNLNLIADNRPRDVAVFGGDHVYMMDVSRMQERHLDTDAELTVAAIPVPAAEASRFGVLQVDSDGRVIGFAEKPDTPSEIPGRPGWSLASMGNYFFKRDVLVERLRDDSVSTTSSHDFGKDIIPAMVSEGRPVYVYDFGENRVPGSDPSQPPYWRDVGTVDSYFDVNMDARRQLPLMDLYNRSWPLRSAQRNYPPARFNSVGGRAAEIEDSMVCEGSIVSGATVRKSLLGYDCMVHRDAVVENTVMLSGSNVGAGCRIRGVLFDKNCSVEPGTVMGFDAEADRARFPFISAAGIIVVPKGTHIPRTGPIELAGDIATLMAQDEVAQEILLEHAADIVTSSRTRHSFDPVGPRFERYGSAPSDTGPVPTLTSERAGNEEL